MGARGADTTVHAVAVADPDRAVDARQRGAGGAGGRDRDAARLVDHHALAAVAVDGGDVVGRTRPVAVAEHRPQRPLVGVHRRVPRRHRGAADLDHRLPLGRARLRQHLRRPLLRGAPGRRLHHPRQDRRVVAEHLHLGRPPPQPLAGQERADEASRRRPHGDVGAAQIDSLPPGRGQEREGPGDEPLAAAPERDPASLSRAGVGHRTNLAARFDADARRTCGRGAWKSAASRVRIARSPPRSNSHHRPRAPGTCGRATAAARRRRRRSSSSTSSTSSPSPRSPIW